MDPANDARCVLTLDAGGTNLVFSAIQGGQEVVDPITLPTYGDKLQACLDNIVRGFAEARARAPEPPVAISFAFPGPADYPRGIIGDLPNLPAFRGGVALGPMLTDCFQLPAFINNDGDLFALGEAIAGLLPEINARLAQAGSPKRFANLLGVTFGTGFGGGIVHNGKLFLGDNSAGAEIWVARHKIERETNVEEGVSIRAVRRVFAAKAGIAMGNAPEPREIYQIGTGEVAGQRSAAIEAFRRLGEVAGDALANAVALIDGLIVIGGGLSGAHPLFLPALVQEMNTPFINPQGGQTPRLETKTFNLEDPADLRRFLRGETREIAVPGTSRKVSYDPLQRIGVGVSRLGTSRAISIGAYSFALASLE
ncbi:MAG: ROK family protein [Vicinamibacteria bacterium]|nr:ROK family protein [Vicinamibacteria bacterium]